MCGFKWMGSYEKWTKTATPTGAVFCLILLSMP